MIKSAMDLLKDKYIVLLKTLEKLELDNKKIFLIMLALLILIYLDYNLFLKKQFTAIMDIQRQAGNLKIDLGKAEGPQNGSFKTGGVPLKIKKIILPEETVSLLETISALANKNGIRITQMKPVKDSQAKQKEDKISSSTEKFNSLLINLDLVCDYHRLGCFINDLENTEFFITVENMKINPQPADYFKQKVTLVLKTYVGK